MRLVQLVSMLLVLSESLAQTISYNDSMYSCNLVPFSKVTCNCVGQTTTLPQLDFLFGFTNIQLTIKGFKAERLTRTDQPGVTLIQTLNLNDNNIRIVEEDALDGFDSLNRLLMANNAIINLPVSLFGKTPKMFEVKLGRNYIKSIPLGFFSNTLAMRLCYLESNQITDLSDFLFKDLSVLEILDLKSNYIKNITNNTFYGLVSLKSLDLSQNFIVSIEPSGLQVSFVLSSLRLTHNALINITKHLLVSSITDLSLGYNSIKRIQTGSFYNMSIKVLDLSKQKIYVIEDGAFNTLPLLNEIRLEQNQIKSFQSKWFINTDLLTRLTLTSNLLESIEITRPLRIKELILQGNYLNDLDQSAFVNLPNLTELDLSYNFLTEKSLKSLNTLSNLVSLNLDGNKLFDFKAAGLSGLKRLEFLFLKKNSIWELQRFSFKELVFLDLLDLSFNKLETIKSGTFYGLSKITSLILSYNKISVIHPQSFIGLSLLSRLDLDGNLISNIDSSVLIDIKLLSVLSLQFNQIKNVSFLSACSNLRELYLTSNNLTRINSVDFRSISRLEVLELNDNKLTHIDNDVFDNLKNLTHLCLRNSIKMPVEALNLRLVSSHLKYLDLSGNLNVVTNTQEFLSSLKSVLVLKLSGTNLTQFSFKWLPGLSRIETIDLSLNDLSSYLENLNQIDKMTQLLELNLNSAGLTDLDTIRVNKLKIVKRVYLRDNLLTIIKNRAFNYGSLGECHLEILDLSSNRIEIIESEAFSCLYGLKYLNISNNNLGNLEPDSLELSYFVKLTTLDMSLCSLRFMPSYYFENVLTNLILHNNKIEYLKESYFYFLNSLLYLDLSYNRISQIQLDYGVVFFNGLNNIIWLNLSNNQINSDIIDRMYFKSLTDMTCLNLSSNNITELRNGVFHRMEKLHELDLSKNYLNFVQGYSLYFLSNIKVVFANQQSGELIRFESKFAYNTQFRFLYLQSTSIIRDNLVEFLELEPYESKKRLTLHGTVVNYYESVNILTDTRLIDREYCLLSILLLRFKIFLNLSTDKDVELLLSSCRSLIV